MQFAFEDFVLNTDTVQLTRGGAEIALEPRVLGLLQLLLENRHRVVSKDEVIEHLWQGRHTSDAAISTCVRSLRKALQDDGDQQRFVRTQWGRGFRFVADVAELSVPEAVAIAVVPSAPVTDQIPLEVPIPPQGKPSLIVLPWQSLIVGHHDGVLAEAMAHELIQGLARLRWLRVIARGTAFQFSPKADLRDVGSRLGVRYALCGSLEAVPNGWAITVELSNCETADVLWAERYQARTEALHEIRHQIITSVIAALEIYIPQQEATLASGQAPALMDAWANYHLGLRHMFRFNVKDNALARDYFERAIAQDARFARAWAGLSFTRFQDAFVHYDPQPQIAIADARRHAETSVELDPLDPFTHYNMGRSFWLEGDMAGGVSWLERAVALSPNFAQGHYSCAFSEVIQGDAARAQTGADTALSTSPLDPLLYAIYGVKSFASLMQDALPEALNFADRGARAPGAHYLIYMIAAAMFALAGDKAAVKYWHERALKLNAGASQAQFFAAFPFVDAGMRQQLSSGLTLAGFE